MSSAEVVIVDEILNRTAGCSDCRSVTSDVGVRIQNKSDRFIGDLSNGGHDLVVKHGEIRINEKDAILARTGMIAASKHIHPRCDMANNAS